MSRHKIIFDVELTDGDGAELALLHIRIGMIIDATENYGIKDYEDGVALGEGGYEGPFITGISAVADDHTCS